MNRKPLALIVEDDPHWQKILNTVLSPNFTTLIAETTKDALSQIEQHTKSIKLAVVDIRLGDKPQDQEAGVNILITLRSRGIPSIAATVSKDAEIVRDCFMKGGVKDYWFKDNVKIADLASMIDQVLTNPKEGTKSVGNQTILPFFLASIIFPIVAFGILITVALVAPGYLITIISAGLIISILQIITFALFTKKITNKQFSEIMRDIVKGTKGVRE